jgi:hypothetical protein
MHNLRQVLATVNGSSFVGADFETIAPCRKTLGGKRGTGLNPHYQQVRKVHKGASLVVFQNKNINGYESMVERRLIAEGKNPSRFELQPRKWGTRIPNFPIVTHTPRDCVNPKFYLEVIFLRPGETTYFYQGKPIDKDDIIGLQIPSHSDEYQGGLDDDVPIRTFCVDNVTELRIDHMVYHPPFTFI